MPRLHATVRGCAPGLYRGQVIVIDGSKRRRLTVPVKRQDRAAALADARQECRAIMYGKGDSEGGMYR